MKKEIPLSLAKKANEVIEFPESARVDSDVPELKDLYSKLDDLASQSVDYLEFANGGGLPPGKVKTVMILMEDALNTFGENVFEIETYIKSFLSLPEEDAEVKELDSDG